jgi:hypothetical protein
MITDYTYTTSILVHIEEKPFTVDSISPAILFGREIGEVLRNQMR